MKEERTEGWRERTTERWKNKRKKRKETNEKKGLIRKRTRKEGRKREMNE